MLAVRYVYVLALTVWVGGAVVLAGIAREALDRFHPIAYAAGATAIVALVVLKLVGPRPRHFGLRLGIWSAMLAAQATAAVAGVAVLAHAATAGGLVLLGWETRE